MKRITAILSLLLTFTAFSSAQIIHVSDSTQISLLTCSPGLVSYEKFGHTGVRIFDEAQGIDLTANWGLFDFSAPGFYAKFVRGETYYFLGIHQTGDFLWAYRERNSSVTEQVLDLSFEQKKQLVEKIMLNNQPENREYLYNFVFDNCATRPRDLIEAELQAGSFDFSDSDGSKTFRDWVAQYAGANSWLMFGIDLVFGRDADRPATAYESQFLPEVLEEFADKAQVIDEDGSVRPLVSEKQFLVSRIDVEEPKASFYENPLIASSLLFILVLLLSVLTIKRKRPLKILDFILHLAAGLAGVVIVYLMFFSIHPLVKSNFNLLWANPLSLVTAFLILFSKNSRLLRGVHIFYLVLYLLALIVTIFAVQRFNFAFIPLIMLLIVRSLSYVLKNRKEHKIATAN